MRWARPARCASAPSSAGVAGVSPKMLTQRLRELEADALVWREQEPTIPPKVTYGLTPMGCEVHAALKGFDAPARRWMEER